ncbi:MAG: shikimate dehydrogenase [Inquilinus limosus]|uniref:Shikimate dehydrogenase (NADP(+)) n=1 Tax=Inquilinus limosus TaxID=171674 RepID=A0A952FPX1_9PROT|nr:shikimate dehydrogenase [Inquilinus limosus]
MLTAKGRLAGVIGWPVGHSRSPQLHGHWLARYSIDGAYVPMAVAPERLETALRGLAALGFRGCNVTVPHKEAAMALVDELDPLARRIAAVNTIVVREDGRLFGTNTDGFGFLANLQAGSPGWSAGRGPAVVVGAGGAARAVIVALTDAGAPEIRLANRTRAPALDLALDALPADALVNDIVYVPLETPLLAAARARGNPVVDGVGMLLHQARPGFESWFGVAPVVDAALRAAVLGAG